MSLKERINADIKKAMLAREKEKLTALRSIKAMILLAETEKGQEGELDESKELSLLSKAAKQRKESLEIYEKQDRPDLAATEKIELEVIQAYLPAMMNPEEVERRLKGLIQTLGISSTSEIGKLMGPAMKEMQGKADGKLIKDIATKLLTA